MINSGAERDVFLLGALTCISGCLPHVRFSYDSNWFHPNLFTCVLAPPASGKGNFMRPKVIAQAMDKLIYNETNKRILQAKANNHPASEWMRPSGLIFPGNTTQAAFMDIMKTTGGVGIVLETEIDRLGLGKKNDYNMSSSMYRDLFQHDTLKSATKSGGTIRIDNPKVALGVTGTMNQLKDLTKSIEDGLYSRIIFYKFAGDPVLKNLSPHSSGKDHYTLVNACKAMGEAIANNYSRTPVPIEYYITEQQAADMVDYFNQVKDNTLSKSATKHATIVRMMIIVQRICCILTFLSNMDNPAPRIQFNNRDFYTALDISRILVNHALYIADITTDTNGR